MENNIDEDIKIKEALEEVELYKKGQLNLGTWEDFKKELNIDEDIKFIKEMVKEYRTFGDLDNPEYEDTEKIYDVIKNVLSELETYKKIAEKLASYIEEAGIMNKSVPINENDINSPRTVAVAKMRNITDWARKEVEKDE